MIHTPHYLYETDAAYSDVGPDQRLTHQGLLRILQEAAAIASDEVGYGLKDIPRTGVHWILSGWRVELKNRPSWRAGLRVETWPRAMDGFLSDRDFLVRSGGDLVAQGTSRWLLLNAGTGRMTRISDTVRSAYAGQMDETSVFGGEELSGNGKTPEGTPAAFETVVGRRDIDTNHHVNNLHYLDYAVEALPEEVYQSLPDTVEIAFRRQILLGTPIRCLYSLTEDGRHQVEIRSENGGKTTHHAFVWFYDNKKEGST